jgi:hypothetical protein
MVVLVATQAGGPFYSSELLFFQRLLSLLSSALLSVDFPSNHIAMEKDKEIPETIVSGSEDGYSEVPTKHRSRASRFGSGLKKTSKDIIWAITVASDGVQDWTPFLLVASYFVFSVCIYMLATSGITEIFWFVYLMTNTYIAGATVIEAMMSIGANHEASKMAAKVAQKNWTFPTPDSELGELDIIIVAYLPNEQGIIMDRIHYLLDKIVYPRDKLCITVLYNTPFEIEPLESHMHDLSLKRRELMYPPSTTVTTTLIHTALDGQWSALRETKPSTLCKAGASSSMPTRAFSLP